MAEDDRHARGDAASVGEVTRLLREVSQGNKEALDRLMPLVYQDLRRLAGSFMRREGAAATLQTTALVHEAYLRLVDQRAAPWQNRAHFFAIAAQAMRRILVERARARRTDKRGGGWERMPLDEDAIQLTLHQSELVVLLDAALSRLEQMAPRQSKIIELRFFGGLTEDETAEVLAVSPRTVKRDGRAARAWLNRELGAPL
jgi:RNA polymerase sigma factor (TIGR02999 family)